MNFKYVCVFGNLPHICIGNHGIWPNGRPFLQTDSWLKHAHCLTCCGGYVVAAGPTCWQPPLLIQPRLEPLRCLRLLQQLEAPNFGRSLWIWPYSCSWPRWQQWNCLRLIVFHAKNFNNADIGWQLAPALRTARIPHKMHIPLFVFRLCRQGRSAWLAALLQFMMLHVFLPLFSRHHTPLWW